MPPALPTERDNDGLRLRGCQVTGLEGFVDASFAFSLTLLVIFFNELPDSVDELPMWVYALLGAVMPMYWIGREKRRPSVLAASTA